MLDLNDEEKDSCNSQDSYHQFSDIERESCTYNVEKDVSSTQKKHLFLGYASDGLLKEMKVLLDEGVDINSVYEQCGFTALMMASMNSHVKIVKELINRGADVSMVDWVDKKTAYQLADNRNIRDLLQVAASQRNQA